MAGIDRDLVLSKTLQVMRKTDPGLTGVRSVPWQLNSHGWTRAVPFSRQALVQILARSTVVFVAVWKPDVTATEQQQKAGRGEWVCAPVCMCTLSDMQHI